MINVRLPLGTLFLLVGLVSGASASEAIDRRTVEISLADYPRGAFDLELLHLSGTVTYRTWTEDRVEVTFVRVGTGKDLPEAETHRDSIRLGTSTAKRSIRIATLAWGFPDFWRAIDYVKRKVQPAMAHIVIRAPARVRAHLMTAYGSIALKDVEGKIHAKSDQGAVLVQGAKGALELETSSGAIWIEGKLDARIRARTRSGTIRARECQGDLDFESKTGSLYVDYRILGRGDQHLWTDTGTIEVGVPLQSDIRFEMHASPDRITTSLNLSATQHGAHRFSGVLNAPLCEMAIGTRSGKIRVSGR